MFSYKTLKHPDQLFDVELKLYNAITLQQLIPSIDSPVIDQSFLIDPSQDKYIFGSIKYKRKEDARPLTTVTLRISSPNNVGGLNPRLESKDLVFEFVNSEIKSYFLIPLPAVAMDTSDDQAILNYKIIKAIAVER